MFGIYCNFVGPSPPVFRLDLYLVLVGHIRALIFLGVQILHIIRTPNFLGGLEQQMGARKNQMNGPDPKSNELSKESLTDEGHRSILASCAADSPKIIFTLSPRRARTRIAPSRIHLKPPAF